MTAEEIERAYGEDDGGLRPTPEHNGKRMHWIQMNGCDPTTAQWTGSGWLLAGCFEVFSPATMAACRYRYLDVAEWQGRSRDAALRRSAELEAKLRGAEAAMSSICRADDRTFAAYQARIEELEAEVSALRGNSAKFPLNALRHGGFR